MDYNILDKLLAQFFIEQGFDFLAGKSQFVLEGRRKNGQIQHVFSYTQIRGVSTNGFAHQLFPQRFHLGFIELRSQFKFLQHVFHGILQRRFVFLYHPTNLGI